MAGGSRQRPWIPATLVFVVGFALLLAVEGPIHRWWVLEPGRPIPDAPWYSGKGSPILPYANALLPYRFLGEDKGFRWIALLVACAAFATSRSLRRTLHACLVPALGVALTSGVTTLMKIGIPRRRPAEFLDTDRTLESFLWFGSFSDAWKIEWKWMSFPSGHAAAAVALAWTISWLWPNNIVRGVVWPLAILCAFSRFLTLSHYLSDIWLGAFISLAICAVITDRLPHPFHRQSQPVYANDLS